MKSVQSKWVFEDVSTVFYGGQWAHVSFIKCLLGPECVPGPGLLLELQMVFVLTEQIVKEGRKTRNTAGEYFSHHHLLAD